MNSIEQNLANWKDTRVRSIPIAGLLSRNPVAYKWKSTFRCWMLREAVYWRLLDLLNQSYLLYQQGHGLGARILLRSAFESLATLIYLNQLTEQVLEGKLNFDVFGEKTNVLKHGSRNDTTPLKSINIVTVLKKCDRRYPGLMSVYANLSESAHPSYEGLCTGYSTINHSEYETIFSNRWMELYGDSHLDSMEQCMNTFHHEYNEVWADLIVKLENWIETNDAELEATKNDPSSAD
jgi:hypothetical protein